MRRAALLREQQSAAGGKATPDAARKDTSSPIKQRSSIVVFGSCFLDYIAYVKRIPSPGQTLPSESFAKGFGGKGANQAVMAAKLGAPTRMVALVGDDADGTDYIANFERNGVDTAHVQRVDGVATGLALISVNVNNAENAIVICPNAAGQTSFDRCFKGDPLRDAAVLLCQNEIPLTATLAALKHAHERGIYTIFNTAPAPTAEDILLIKPYLRYVTLLCPNEHEAKLMSGVAVVDYDTAVAAARVLQSMGVVNVVVTLGQNGAAVVESDHATHVRGIAVRAVDTTGAGDAFVGAMAYFLSIGDDLNSSCRKANVCAALSVTRRGTQASYPARAELPQDLFSR